MEKAYIGTVIKGTHPRSPLLHNKGWIYRLNEYGKYYCNQSLLTLDKDQIAHDVKLGYLVPYTENIY